MTTPETPSTTDETSALWSAKTKAAALLAWATVLAVLASLAGFIAIHTALTWTPGRGEYLDDSPATAWLWVTVVIAAGAATCGGLGVWRSLRDDL